MVSLFPLESSIPGCYPPQARPVRIPLAQRNRGKEVIANQTGYRHRRDALLRRLEHQANVLQPQFQGKTRRLEFPLRDTAPVVRVYGEAKSAFMTSRNRCGATLALRTVA